MGHVNGKIEKAVEKLTTFFSFLIKIFLKWFTNFSLIKFKHMIILKLYDHLKSCQNINYFFFSFSHKNFLKMVP